ncbi:hypothetical protein [Methanopyrus kandleri]
MGPRVHRPRLYQRTGFLIVATLNLVIVGLVAAVGIKLIVEKHYPMVVGAIAIPIVVVPLLLPLLYLLRVLKREKLVVVGEDRVLIIRGKDVTEVPVDEITGISVDFEFKRRRRRMIILTRSGRVELPFQAAHA